MLSCSAGESSSGASASTGWGRNQTRSRNAETRTARLEGPIQYDAAVSPTVAA